jgi:PhoPQ-activated pathogenicity-related protein
VFLRHAQRVLSALFLISHVAVANSDNAPVLQAYVSAPDAAYRYQRITTQPVPGATVHFLEMTSQQWPREGDPARAPWRHALAVVLPASTASSTGLMFVGGGSNALPLRVSNTELQLAVQIAIASQTVVTVLGQVPNQPLLFEDASPQSLSEDALVAYTWDRAMDTGDASYVAYLPMTKAIVRAMDTVQSFAESTLARSVDDFVVTGFSKRGAVTWLAAAVDDRVRAIAPGVFDFLNMAEQVEHHFAAYGFFAPAVIDYEGYDILKRLRTPEGKALRAIVDPLSYKRSLSLPKFLINSPGDQFFTPDSSHRYVAALPGETRLRYVPNTDHSLSSVDRGPEDALLGLLGWYQSVLVGAPRGQVQSFVSRDEIVVRTTGSTVLSVAHWSASNENTRDFRRESIGPSWTSMPLVPQSDGTYRAPLTRPATGWSAHFVEVKFAGPVLPQVFSTPVYITPNAYPYQLDDPVAEPRSEYYWRNRLSLEVTNPMSPLRSAFPMPVLGQSIPSLEHANALLHRSDQSSLRKCLASRLNVADGQVGWYSKPIGTGPNSVYPVLLLWNWAYEFRNAGDAAGVLCESINNLDAF